MYFGTLFNVLEWQEVTIYRISENGSHCKKIGEKIKTFDRNLDGKIREDGTF
jgi:hypothetical protein